MAMTKTNGIDVSEWQGDINWSEVNTDFVIIRAGYGREASQKDKKFEQNYSGAKSKGIPCGAYWYSYALSEDEARKEASVCIEILKDKRFEYPIYFDVEEQKIFDLGCDKVSRIISAFCNELEKAGFFAGLYMSAYPLKTYVSETVRKRYAVWVANYEVSKPNYDGQYGIWQKSSEGKVDGISGNVDLNEGYIDYTAAIKAAGVNGFRKGTVAPATVSAHTKEELLAELLALYEKYS